MKRREFITLLGGVAAAWPLAVQAQQPERVRRIGVLMNTTASDAEAKARFAAFLAGAATVSAGPTAVTCESMFGGSAAPISKDFADKRRNWSRLRRMSSLRPPRRQPWRRSRPPAPCRSCLRWPSIPIGGGFVESLARPGGNITGFMQFEYTLSGKWLELLKQIAPGVTRAAVFRDPANPSGIGQFAVIQAMAPPLGIEVIPINCATPPRSSASSPPSRAAPMAAWSRPAGRRPRIGS